MSSNLSKGKIHEEKSSRMPAMPELAALFGHQPLGMVRQAMGFTRKRTITLLTPTAFLGHQPSGICQQAMASRGKVTAPAEAPARPARQPHRSALGVVDWEVPRLAS